MHTKITPDQIRSILPDICSGETAYDSKSWTSENPLGGHCAIVSAIAQDIFGGEIVRMSLADTEFAHLSSHYWNRLPDGSIEDFTRTQFGDRFPQGLQEAVKDRSYILSPTQPGTIVRYKLLAYRLAKVLSGNNPLFKNDIYRRCFYAALDSPCQKMRFGCVILWGREVVYEGTNQTIRALKSLCESTCIRHTITSRTESMLGACGHAEEKGLWEVAHRGIPINTCDLYIAGFFPDFSASMKKQPEHTCLRCAVQMHNAGIRRIYVPVIDRWEYISTEHALETARAYATQEKRI